MSAFGGQKVGKCKMAKSAANNNNLSFCGAITSEI